MACADERARLYCSLFGAVFAAPNIALSGVTKLPPLRPSSFAESTRSLGFALNQKDASISSATSCCRTLRGIVPPVGDVQGNSTAVKALVIGQHPNGNTPVTTFGLGLLRTRRTHRIAPSNLRCLYLLRATLHVAFNPPTPRWLVLSMKRELY